MHKNVKKEKKNERFAKDDFGDIIDESYSTKKKAQNEVKRDVLRSVIKKITHTS